jgi:hypothetical protein
VRARTIFAVWFLVWCAWGAFATQSVTYQSGVGHATIVVFYAVVLAAIATGITQGARWLWRRIV